VSGSAGKLGALAAFWIAAGLIQTFNWGSGIPKALVMLAVLASAPVLLTAARRSAPPAPPFARGVAIAFWTALAFNLVYLGARIIAPHIIDIGTTTLAAGQALLLGQNPYALPLDTISESAGFTGYKYLPLMILDYLPLGAPFGQRGVLITNLALLLACLWLLKRIAGTMLGPLALVMLPLVAEQIFAKGATDLAAVLPLLAALALIERSSFWCGLCVGLSIATKLLPGAAMLPALIPASRRDLFVAGILVGLLPILPFAAWGPQDLWGNIVLFNLSRLPDSTSWLRTMPGSVASAAHLVFTAAMLATAIHVLHRKPTVMARAMLAAMLGIAAILAGPGAHHNYQLWWLPFYALALALALAPEGRVGYINAAEFAAKEA
jgi:glycosyl transferase family 87